MISEWTLSKLEAVADSERVLLRDPLRLLPEADGAIHTFARDNGFTVIVASTNLVFRELFEKAIADPETRKLLVIDRAPARRRTQLSIMKAPPPFYPDLLDKIPPEARITLDLRQFLKETTGDPHWPSATNDPRYARLISRHLDGVIRAHENLRTADPRRFTDYDFKVIVAYAALGVPESAFKTLDAEDYWRIGLLGHDALEECEALAPEITKPIRDALRKAPAPFCWFAEHEADMVLRAFYLSVILSQHFEHWSLLLANVDPALAHFSGIEPDILREAAPKLIRLDPEQAERDIEAVEETLGKDALQLLFFDQLKISEPRCFLDVVEKEKYSTLVRALALLMALDDLLSNRPAQAEHERIANILFGEQESRDADFVEKRATLTWSHLKEAYSLAGKIQHLRDELSSAIKTLRVLKPDQLSFERFQEWWNHKKINRLEFFTSALERLVYSGDFLPRHEDELPSAFSNALERIREQTRRLSEDVHKNLDELNARFQEMVVQVYPLWVREKADVRLTSQFLRRCLKPHWDPQTENAVVFIFDGMRYDIWDELLRPMFEDRMELLQEYPACALLPSETHISRKAITAGTFPDEFDTHSGEDKLLKEGLARVFGFDGEVEVVTPFASGTGETVRYRAGKLDVYIFELCDKELHNIKMKTLPDGRLVPSRPLAFIYQQHLKNIIDTEVMAIVRGLAPGTKVFVVADHGFGRVHRQKVWLEMAWLNEPQDCSYLNAFLRQSLDDLKAPAKVKARVWEFPVSVLRMPATESAFDRQLRRSWQKQYASVIFPKTGYALSRPNSHFNPDAYSHGGISIQELMIPMAVLRVREKDEGLIILDEISGPREVVEGQEVEFRLHLSPSPASGRTSGELRVDVEAEVSVESGKLKVKNEGKHARPIVNLPSQVLFLSRQDQKIFYRFRPDAGDATDEERREGIMERVLTITVSYRHGGRTFKKSRTRRFVVRLNSERVIRRVPAHLGNILGLKPKSMR